MDSSRNSISSLGNFIKEGDFVIQNSFYILPKTKSGKYAVVFIVIVIVLVTIVIMAGMNIDTPLGNAGFFSNMPLAVMTLGAFSCAIISTINGLVAVIKNKEQSAMVYLCILIGALAIYFGIAQIVGEITDSH